MAAALPLARRPLRLPCQQVDVAQRARGAGDLAQQRLQVAGSWTGCRTSRPAPPGSAAPPPRPVRPDRWRHRRWSAAHRCAPATPRQGAQLAVSAVRLARLWPAPAGRAHFARGLIASTARRPGRLASAARLSITGSARSASWPAMLQARPRPLLESTTASPARRGRELAQGCRGGSASAADPVDPQLADLGQQPVERGATSRRSRSAGSGSRARAHRRGWRPGPRSEVEGDPSAGREQARRASSPAGRARPASPPRPAAPRPYRAAAVHHQ